VHDFRIQDKYLTKNYIYPFTSLIEDVCSAQSIIQVNISMELGRAKDFSGK